MRLNLVIVAAAVAAVNAKTAIAKRINNENYKRKIKTDHQRRG